MKNVGKRRNENVGIFEANSLRARVKKKIPLRIFFGRTVVLALLYCMCYHRHGDGEELGCDGNGVSCDPAALAEAA